MCSGRRPSSSPCTRGGGVQAQGREVMGDGGGGVGGANEGGEGHVEGPGDGVHVQGGEVMGGD